MHLRSGVNKKKVWYCGAWRTPETIERKKEQDRERKRKKYHLDLDAARLENRYKYHQNIDKERKRSRQYYYKNKEQENTRRTEWGRKNAERQAASRIANRNKSKATSTIERLTKSFREGHIGCDEYTRGVEQALITHNERLSQQYGHRDESREIKKTGLRKGGAGNQCSQRHSQKPTNPSQHRKTSNRGKKLKK